MQTFHVHITPSRQTTKFFHTRFTNHITAPRDSTHYHPITQSSQPTHSLTRTTHQLLLIQNCILCYLPPPPTFAKNITHTHTSPHSHLPTINRNAQPMHYTPLLNPSNATPNAANNNKSKKERNKRKRITHTPSPANEEVEILISHHRTCTHSAPLRPSNLHTYILGEPSLPCAKKSALCGCV